MKGKKTGGRKKGTKNKVTQITHGVINDIAVGMYDKVMDDIKKLSAKDRVQVFIKLLEFNVAKPQSIAINLNKDAEQTIEDQLRDLSGEKVEDVEDDDE